MPEVSSLPPMPQPNDDSAMKLIFKIAAITAGVLLVLFGLYWAGKQWLLPQPGAQVPNKPLPDVTVVQCEEIYTDLLQALIDSGQFDKQICGIDVSDGKLISLTQGISTMESLKILRANNNNIKELPEWVNELPNLTILELRGNKISSIPVGVAELQKLQTLDLTGNPLDPSEVENIQKLMPNTAVKF